MFCEVESIRWVPHEQGRKKCCSIFASEQNGDFDQYGYCLNLCALCCKKLIITFKDCAGGKDPDAPSPVDPPIETVTPGDNGVSFSQSSYGVPLPIVFGSDKLNGNVFWASSVRQHEINGGTEYYRTVDFAFGLCEGIVNGILRIWLGDRVIYDNSAEVDVNGVMSPARSGAISSIKIDLTDPNSPLRNLDSTDRQTKITVYDGSETQLPDPYIAELEGYENTPAYRGVAYVVFENFIVSDTSIPSLFVEVASNTDINYPRIYGADPVSEVFFDELTGQRLIVDPGFDFVHVAGRDSNGSATPANGRGWRKYYYNTLEYVDEVELNSSESITPNYNLTRLLPYSGYLMMHQASGNAGILYTYNPHAKVILDTLGPGGGVSDHNILTGLSALAKGTIAFKQLSATKPGFVDVLMGVGTANSAIGFVEVDEDGQMEFVRNLGSVMSKQDARSVWTQYDETFVEDNPTFLDDVDTLGSWVFMVVQEDGGEPLEFKVARMKVADEYYNSLISTATYEEFATISVDEIRGDGIVHNVSNILVDPADGCLVVFCTIANTNDEPVAFKWSPFDGEVKWVSAVPGYEQTAGTDVAILNVPSYHWITNGDGAIYEINLTTGMVTQIEALVSNQNLPVPNSFEQFWNGTEQTITYLSNTPNQRVTKIFLERISRVNVELGDIVQGLLSRVGLLATDMDIEDVTTLTLNGYTVAQPQSLRTCFGELAQVFKYDVVESNGRVKYLARGGDAAATINHKWFGDTDDEGWLAITDDNDIARIRKLNLTYRDIDREYRNSVQSISLPKIDNYAFDVASAIDVTVPVVLDATTAKKLAEILMYAKLTYDTTYEGELPGRYMHLDPGDIITVQPDDTGDNDFQMRLRRTIIGADRTVKFEASREDPDIYNDVVNLFASSGRYIEPVFPIIPPRIEPIVLQMPYRSEAEGEEVDDKYYLYCTFLNVRATSVIPQNASISINGTQRYRVKPLTTFPTWGYVTNPPVARSSLYSTDNESQLRVKIMSTSGAQIASASHAELLASDQCNLCWVDGELLQFTTATNEGDGVWLFTGLHRAKLGTDIMYGSAVVGSRFILLGDNTGTLDDGSIRRILVRTTEAPAMAAQFLMKSQNPFQPNPILGYTALNLQAWTVAALAADYNGTDLEITWQRRTRFNGELPDDGDETTPVNETDESYVIYLYTDDAEFDITDADTYLRREDVTTNNFTYTSAMQTEDGFDRTTQGIYLAIYQRGSLDAYRTGATRKRYIAPTG